MPTYSPTQPMFPQRSPAPHTHRSEAYRFTGYPLLLVKMTPYHALAACPALIYVDGRMPVIRLRLLSDGSRVLAGVWDQAPGFPAPRRAACDAESGRGLHLVNVLTRGRWGWEAVDSQAKVVWARNVDRVTALLSSVALWHDA